MLQYFQLSSVQFQLAYSSQMSLNHVRRDKQTYIRKSYIVDQASGVNRLSRMQQVNVNGHEGKKTPADDLSIISKIVHPSGAL